MTYLLDTNVISEWTKPRPDAGVLSWLAEVDEDRVFMSVATLAELRHGIERLPVGARRDRLDAWLREELPQRFEGRVLAVNDILADVWGRMMARAEALGRRMGVMDGLLAATAEVHELTLVTRNVADFRAAGTAVLNPWGRL